MSELALRDSNQSDDTDSWIGVLGPVGDLAGKIATTDFVPDAMKGKPAAVAAAILAGREMGVPPMTALANINVIKGKPGQSAQLMRQLILAAGHELLYIETTDTRCVVEGRRRGEENWQRVSFTADQAKKAGINLGGYPEDKLVARATSRLARRVFADVLGGMSYLPEEAAEISEHDLVEGLTEAPAIAPAEPEKRTARRARKPAAAKPKPTVDEPPLDDDVIDAELVDEPPLDEPEHQAQPDPATTAQVKAIAAAIGGLGISERDHRIQIAGTLSGEENLDSTKGLTKAQASTVIDRLKRIEALSDPLQALDAIVDQGNPSGAVIEQIITDFEAMR